MKTDLDDSIAYHADMVRVQEEQIDMAQPVYMITWCPSPSQLPDCSFEKQHYYNVNSLADFLKYCECGAFCLEEFQKGDPHYHGWYQIDPSKRMGRITMIKLLQRFGRVEIRKVLDTTHIKINNYSPKGNVLWYYKKQLAEMASIPHAVIDYTSQCNIDHVEYSNFFERFMDRKTVAYLADVEANRRYYRQYYKIFSNNKNS